MPRRDFKKNPDGSLVVLPPLGERAGGRPNGHTRPQLLNERTTALICEAIERGAFTWVACQAAGISVDAYDNWCKRGRTGEQPYRDFLEAVETAHARARIAAEQSVFAVNPLAWLKMGPGRDRPGRPGWSDRPAEQPAAEREVVRFTVRIGENEPTPMAAPDPSADWPDLDPEEQAVVDRVLLPPPLPTGPSGLNAGQPPLDDGTGGSD